MKPNTILKIAPTVLWFALIPRNASAQGEPPPAEPPPAAAAPAPALKPPRFHITTGELNPGSVIEVDFPASVVPADKVNTDTDLITTSPAIPGKGIWTSRTTARFTFTQPPPLGTTVSFSLRPGAKYEDGRDIPVIPAAVSRTPDFRVVSWPHAGGTEREPVTVLVFNDAVSAEKAAPFLLYVNNAGERAPAKSGVLLYKDAMTGNLAWSLGLRGDTAAAFTWADRWLPDGNAPAPLKPEDALPNAIVVRPHSPLGVADNWRIEMLAGLPNAAGTAALPKASQAGGFSISQLRLTGVQHSPAANATALLRVLFSRPLPDGVDWNQWIALSPAAKDLKITKTGPQQLTLESPDIKYRSGWTVTLKAGAPSESGVPAVTSQQVQHTPLPDAPDLSMPSWDTAQLAAGERTYRIHTKNLKSARVRVKLLSGEDAVRTLRGYASMMPSDGGRSGRPKREDAAAEGAVPWSFVPGRVLLDKEWTFEGRLDTSYPIVLNWTELLGGSKTPGVLFVSAEGVPLDAAVDQKNEERGRIAQAFVQLTDIGLAWKLNHAEALIYAFSLESGQPLPNTRLTLNGSGEARTFTTDAQGITRVPRMKDATLLTAATGGDQFTFAFDRTMPRERLWRFPVEVDWNPARDFRRQVMMFTDRGLYRPGGTVHMKGIVRKRLDTDLRMADEQEAQFSVLDSDEKPLVDKKVTLSGNGTFSESFTLPESRVGRYTLKLEFPKPIRPETAAQGEEREGEFEGEYDYGEEQDDFVFTESFRVEEFRRNSFEIQLEAPVCAPGTLKTEVPVTANYLMGQHLSAAAVRYYAGAESVGFYPLQYRDYLFGDHDGYDPGYWSYYYGWSDERYEDDQIVRSSDSQSGEITLGKDGTARVPVVIPQPEFPSSHRVNVSVEVTDVNQQTLTEGTSFTVHASDVQVGVSRPEELVRTGHELPLKVLALTTEQKPLTRPLPVHVKVEHEVYETVKVETGSGITQTRSEPRRTVVKETDLTLPAAAGALAEPLVWPFTPEKAGTYLIELRAMDEAGRETATRTRFYCYGEGDYAWEYEQGARIRLLPEKKSWKPGETARVLVMTPVEGSALVSLERAGVVRAFTTKLTLENPVIEFPLTDEDAPNVYVSVAVIKGLADNKRAVKEPVLKLGYCQLVVENTKDALAVNITVPRASYRPGAKAEISGEVKTSDGQPAAGAEVTLWAVDEGVLSVLGYENPDPVSHFMPLLPLSVRCGTSLELYLPEDVKRRYYENKGFLIGGGDEDPESAGRLRKDFNPLAFWQADIVTDAQGRYTAAFTVPDTLTRYRVLALAVKGARGFGAGSGALTVNKPLMLEPAVPRFASVGDVLLPKAVVHNTGTWSGKFAVTLEIGDGAQFTAPDATRRSLMQHLELAAGETKALTWNVQFTHYGETVWRWRAEPVTLPENCPPADRAELVDYVESRFPVKYPGPLLSEQKFLVLTAEKPAANLLDGFNPELLKRATRVELELSRSRFTECAEAMDYLLTYPYGCVEQTSSSTMPWLAVRDLQGHIPKLRRTDAEVARMIQAGADRLLTMRTDSGALAYWPGAAEPNLWGSCWGGLTLIRCREAGASVPADAVDRLCAYLSGEVRRLFASGQQGDLQHAAAALTALAYAGKPEQAWQSKLYDQRALLSRGARAWLALAIVKSGGQPAQSMELLTTQPVDAREPHEWFSHGEYAGALELFAWCHVAPQHAGALAAMDSLAGKRGSRGHWHTTFNNAWSLNAFAAWAAKAESQPEAAGLTLSGLVAGQFILTKESPALFFDLKPKGGTEVTLPANLNTAAAGTRLYANVKLTGQPELLPVREVNSGLGITRRYQRLAVDGTPEPLGEPRVGDLVLVTLQLQVPQNVHYIAVDDPLPGTFEAVNPEFASQAAAGSKANAQLQPGWRAWVSSHEELRDDRALFFCDYLYGGSSYEIRYLARVTGEGEATAAQAKIEAMYSPEQYGLSASERVKTLPRAKDGKDVADASGVR